MIREEQAVLSLIAKSLFDQKIDFEDQEAIDWGRVVKLCLEQEVLEAVFEPLEAFFYNEQLRAHYLRRLSGTIAQVEYAREVFSAFKDAELPFLPLKGMTIRDVYPVSEMRSMGDLDVLVHPEDYNVAAGILETLGYSEQPEEEESAHHVVFFHEIKGAVELHHGLMDFRRHEGNYMAFEKKMWERTIEGSVCGVPSKLMNHEDTLVYLLMHMASHFLVSGIGIKQVLDFTLYSRLHQDKIEWHEFWKVCGELNLTGLAEAVVQLSNQWLGTALPMNPSLSSQRGAEVFMAAEALLSDIWRSGNLGRESIGKATGSVFLKDPHQTSGKGLRLWSKNTRLLIRHFRLEVGKMYPRASELSMLLPLLYIGFFSRRVLSKGGGGFGALRYAWRSIGESRRRYALARTMRLR